MERLFGKSMVIEVQQILQWHLVMYIALIPDKKFKPSFIFPVTADAGCMQLPTEKKYDVPHIAGRAVARQASCGGGGGC